ncbi:MAG: hemolysin family protein [Flavobacteriales bacterium]
MALLLTFFCIAIFFSFLCSLLEAVLLSVTSIFLKLKKREGRKYAYTLERLKNDIDQPLIAILTLNTIAHTVGSLGVGAAANDAFGTRSWVMPVVSIAMTLSILIASEIIPKTIGAIYWKRLARFSAQAIAIVLWSLRISGILWTLRLFTRLISKDEKERIVSREDFEVMTDEAGEKGVFQESETKVIKNLLRFKNIFAKDIMTPRTVIQSAAESERLQDYFEANPEGRFSRIPVYKEELDQVTGYFLRDELLEQLAHGEDKKRLSDIKRDIAMVDEDMPIPDLFEKFIDTREHLAIVVDEFGSVSGVVTMEDIIETLLGLEIMDESDQVTDLQLLARENWQKRAKKLGISNDRET